jgi:tRNA(Ile)-lysidine synthase
MHALERSLLAALRGPCGAARGDKLLLAVSGGPDSMALLHGLLAVRGRLSLRLEVAHFDHGLRAESGREADWVRERVRAAGLPFHLRRSRELSALRAGVQAAAREWRRAELHRLHAALQARAIATGHQRDDHLETLLLKLLRGAHIAGLRGMDWREGPYIRPLLGVSRADVLAYLRGRGLEWLEDPSNASPKYRRNRVRNELLPLLDDLAGGAIAARLERLEAQSRQLRDWLESLPPPRQSRTGEGPAWLDVRALLALPPLAREHALFAFVQRHRLGDLDAAHIAPAIALLAGPRPSGAAWSLNLPGAVLKRRGNRLLLEDTVPVQGEAEHPVDDVTVVAPAGWRVSGARQAVAPANGIWIANLPFGARLLARLRRPGDRFQPAWKDHPVKVKDFLRDQGIPAWERERVPLVLLGGQIAAIYPHYVARPFTAPGAAPSPQPLALRIEPGDVPGRGLATPPARC